MDNTLHINRNKDGVYFGVKVLPRSSRDEIAGYINGKLKIKLTSAPVEGKANSALIKFIANTLDINRNRIRIVRGDTSSHKQLFISGDDKEITRKLLDIKPVK